MRPVPPAPKVHPPRLVLPRRYRFLGPRLLTHSGVIIGALAPGLVDIVVAIFTGRQGSLVKVDKRGKPWKHEGYTKTETNLKYTETAGGLGSTAFSEVLKKMCWATVAFFP